MQNFQPQQRSFQNHKREPHHVKQHKLEDSHATIVVPVEQHVVRTHAHIPKHIKTLKTQSYKSQSFDKTQDEYIAENDFNPQ